MKRIIRYLTPLFFLAALVTTVSALGVSPSAPSQAAEESAPKEELAYHPSAQARLNMWMQQKLGERTLKKYHYKVHQNGVSCELCHNGQNPTAPADDANCIRCHGSASDMAKLTEERAKENDLPNPHLTKHFGEDVPCTTCHKEHKKSELLCANCHKYTYEKFQ